MDQATTHKLQDKIKQLRQQLNARNEEAFRLRRQLGMVEQTNDPDDIVRAKGGAGNIDASAQEGRVQEIEEEILALRRQINALQVQLDQQGATPPPDPR